MPAVRPTRTARRACSPEGRDSEAGGTARSSRGWTSGRRFRHLETEPTGADICRDQPDPDLLAQRKVHAIDPRTHGRVAQLDLAVVVFDFDHDGLEDLADALLHE